MTTVQEQLEELRKLVVELPALQNWRSEIDRLFPKDDPAIRLDWQLPAIGCRALGEAPEIATPAMAALACTQISIILVDDILDEEPDGEHQRMGVGRAANLALALQAAATVLVDRCPVDPARRARAAACLSQMCLDTAAGQELDVRNLRGEESYWRVVRAKSTPFYGAGLQLGAILSGADEQTAEEFYTIGALFGEAIQIYDDLEDAFQAPANSDWAQGRNNLVLLYGLTAEYPEKEHFQTLRRLVSDPASLDEAQAILIRSGALSYCVYQLIQRHKRIRALLSAAGIPQPDAIHGLLSSQLRPVLLLLESLHVSLPEEVVGVGT
jgi:geranylgeranyl pyrophosphate synthase